MNTREEEVEDREYRWAVPSLAHIRVSSPPQCRLLGASVSCTSHHASTGKCQNVQTSIGAVTSTCSLSLLLNTEDEVRRMERVSEGRECPCTA